MSSAHYAPNLNTSLHFFCSWFENKRKSVWLLEQQLAKMNVANISLQYRASLNALIHPGVARHTFPGIAEPLRWADRQYLTQHGPCFQNRLILWMMLCSLTLPEKPLAFWLFMSSTSSCWGSGSAWAAQGLWITCPFWQRPKLSRFTWALLEGLPYCRWALSSPENIPKERWWKHLLVHLGWCRELPRVPRDGGTPKSLPLFPHTLGRADQRRAKIALSSLLCIQSHAQAQLKSVPRGSSG